MVTLSEPVVKARRRSVRIGLDIGASGVRAVELTGKRDGYVVTNAACCDFSRTAGDENVNPRQLARQIEDCFRRMGIHGKSVVVALAPPDVEFHTLELPRATLRADEHDVAQVVRFEVERLMTQPQTDVETRHWRLPESSIPAPNAIGAGVSQVVIARTIEACAQAGLTCSALDTTATALSRFGVVLNSSPHRSRAVGPVGGHPTDRVWGILDVGDRQSRLVLCLGDTPVLVRTAGAGSRAWTQRIADALQLSYKAAEIHKCDHGIAVTGRTAAPPLKGGGAVCRQTRTSTEEGTRDVGTRSELASMILGALRADLNDLAAEVKRSYEYVLSCYPGNQAADLILCGGGSCLHNLTEFLGNALGITVCQASSYLQGDTCRLRFATEWKASLEGLAVAIGLAISE